MSSQLDQKRLDDINESDLTALIDTKVIENKYIEYKEAIALGNDKDKKEFLRDVSSFANTAGGYLLYGIRELAGTPTDIIGLDAINPDEMTLRLDEIIRSGLSPNIYGISYNFIKLANGKTVIIIKIPNSLNSPHQIVYNSDMRFSARGNAGKYQMPVDEIRERIEGSGKLTERLQNFRIERIAKISSNESISRSDRPGGRIILHYLPLAGFSGRIQLPLQKNGENWPIPMPPILGNGYSLNGKYCFEGYNFYSNNANGKTEDYFLIFRNGVMEFVNFVPLRDDPQDPWKHVIGASRTEESIANILAYFIKTTKLQETHPPAYIALTIQGMKNWKWAMGEHMGSPFGVFDRDILAAQEVYIQNGEFDISNTLKKLIDPIWHAVGWEESPNFKAGAWVMGR